jgi:MFS family permease
VTTRQIRLLSLFRFCSALRFGAVFLALYFASVSGSYALGMSVFSFTSGAQLLCDIPLGLLADRIGRKPAIVAGATLSLAFTACYAIGLNFAVLALAATLEGLARAFISGADTALLYDTLVESGQEAAFADAYGRISAAEPFAFALAALAGGAIAADWSFHAAFWLSLPPLAVALVVALLLREPPATHSGERVSLRRALLAFGRSPRLRLLVSAAAWREALGESAYQFRVTFFLQLWPLWAIGLAQTAGNLIASAGFYLSGRMLRRVRPARMLLLDSVLGRLLSVPALLWPTPISPLLMSLPALTYGAGEVAQSTIAQQEFSPRERVTMGSIQSQAINLGFTAGAPLLGLLADHAGVVPALLIAQVLLLAVCPVYALLDRHPEPLRLPDESA